MEETSDLSFDRLLMVMIYIYIYIFLNYNLLCMLLGKSTWFYLAYAEHWTVPVDLIYNWSVSRGL